VVERDHPQISVNLTYIRQTGDAQANTDGGDKYTGLDRFGRVIDQFWLNTSTSTATDRFQYGYDRDSNVLWKNNLVNSAFGELYSYDNLNQLSSFQRGTLNGTHTAITGTPSASQSWSPDAVGNFSSITTDGTQVNNTFNKLNEETGFGSATLTFDSNGNTTTDETGKQFVYDAWNRLVTVKNSSGTTLQSISYDGLSRRVTTAASGTTTDLFYSAAWQVLEERVGSSVTAQYVWSPVYVDAMILRDRSVSGGTLNERLWVMEDANFNVTGVVDSAATVQERYALLPFGNFAVYDTNWNSRSGSNFGWLNYLQGMRFDSISGLFLSRLRPGESPTEDAWTTPDPARFVFGADNLYEHEGDSATNGLDPMGLWPRNRWTRAVVFGGGGALCGSFCAAGPSRCCHRLCDCAPISQSSLGQAPAETNTWRDI